ncbi:MAG: DUF4118 domain-containing protein [Pseudomonadota bacterium]|nr:DUF4118 domain-containing protein [Pseudomonadota bacterium]
MLRYLSGLAVWLISFALRLLIQPLTPYSPHILFIPSLMLVAWLWGTGPALLFLATTTIAASIYFIPRLEEFHLTDPTELTTSLQFIFVAGAVILIIDRLVAARRDLDRELKSTQQLSAQRQTLLEEINHRVKNHLQAIIALTPAGLDDRIDQIRVRMLVLARAYDKLSLKAEGPKVDAETFLAGLTRDFQESLAPNGAVTLNCSVTCRPLTSKEAVYLGLIANEAVSNSLKYAFPDGHGQIEITLHEHDGKRTLVVRDNGEGDAGTIKGTGQGRRLMSRLAQDLCGEVRGGEIRAEGHDGYRVTLTYPAPAQPRLLEAS